MMDNQFLIQARLTCLVHTLLSQCYGKVIMSCFSKVIMSSFGNLKDGSVAKRDMRRFILEKISSHTLSMLRYFFSEGLAYHVLRHSQDTKGGELNGRNQDQGESSALYLRPYHLIIEIFL